MQLVQDIYMPAIYCINQLDARNNTGNSWLRVRSWFAVILCCQFELWFLWQQRQNFLSTLVSVFSIFISPLVGLLIVFTFVCFSLISLCFWVCQYISVITSWWICAWLFINYILLSSVIYFRSCWFSAGWLVQGLR